MNQHQENIDRINFKWYKALHSIVEIVEFGGMAEWLKAAVLKTVVRKYRGFESYFLRHIDLVLVLQDRGEMTELADGARLLSECGG